MPRGVRILVYKRTHTGDPDANGLFGAHDCMGSVRNRRFDAVIGVGGIGTEPRMHGIAHKLNWVGIGPRKTATRKRGPNVRFAYFRDFGTHGPEFRRLAPALARRMYTRNVRHIMDDFTDAEYAEALAILELAAAAPPSRGVRVTRARACSGGCGPRRLVKKSS